MSGKEALMYTFMRITYHARRRKRSCIRVYGLHTIPGEGSGHVYMYTDYMPCQERKRSCIHVYGLHTMPGEEAVMYTCIRIIGTDIDYIPCQEKEAVMYTCIRIIGTDIDYMPCQERKRSCIHVYRLHTMPGEEAVMYTCIRITYHARRGNGHVYMYTDYGYRFCLCFYTFLIKFKNCSEGVACC